MWSDRREVFSGDGMSGIEKCGSVCGDNDKHKRKTKAGGLIASGRSDCVGFERSGAQGCEVHIESKIFTKLYIFFDNHFTCKPNTGNHFPEHNQTIENSFVPKNIFT